MRDTPISCASRSTGASAIRATSLLIDLSINLAEGASWRG